MFVISLSNMIVCEAGLAVPGSPFREWATLEDAIKAATELNAQHGLHAYIHPADRRDLTVEMIDTHSFGYAN